MSVVDEIRKAQEQQRALEERRALEAAQRKAAEQRQLIEARQAQAAREVATHNANMEVERQQLARVAYLLRTSNVIGELKSIRRELLDGRFQRVSMPTGAYSVLLVWGHFDLDPTIIEEKGYSNIKFNKRFWGDISCDYIYVRVARDEQLYINNEKPLDVEKSDNGSIERALTEAFMKPLNYDSCKIREEERREAAERAESERRSFEHFRDYSP